jgi:hypothetical protein
MLSSQLLSSITAPLPRASALKLKCDEIPVPLRARAGDEDDILTPTRIVVYRLLPQQPI